LRYQAPGGRFWVKPYVQFTYLPGFATLNLRGGFRTGNRHEVTPNLQNLSGRDYRGISWGMDASGRSFGFQYNHRFQPASKVFGNVT